MDDNSVGWSDGGRSWSGANLQELPSKTGARFDYLREPQNLTVTRLGDGPNLSVSWTAPINWQGYGYCELESVDK